MKSRPNFQFRQFSVCDDRCSMKVGTDAVLLAAWTDLHNAQRVLDIGTGSGVMALVAAQRTSDQCLIDGVEIQDSDCAQAADNAAASPWASRINMIRTSIQDFHPPYPYDVILCNPPYFINSLRPPGDGRTTARHAISLDHALLITSIDRLLARKGAASLVMPPEEGNQFRLAMESAGMHTRRVCGFRTRRTKKLERVLMTFERAAATENKSDTFNRYPTKAHTQETEIQLYGEGDRWTTEYTELTKDLYLPRI